MDATDNSFHWKGKEVGQGKTFYTDSMQMAKYSDESIWDYWTSREAITSFGTWNCLITD